jgi:hypothetical protein
VLSTRWRNRLRLRKMAKHRKRKMNKSERSSSASIEIPDLGKLEHATIDAVVASPHSSRLETERSSGSGVGRVIARKDHMALAIDEFDQSNAQHPTMSKTFKTILAYMDTDLYQRFATNASQLRQGKAQPLAMNWVQQLVVVQVTAVNLTIVSFRKAS